MTASNKGVECQSKGDAFVENSTGGRGGGGSMSNVDWWIRGYQLSYQIKLMRLLINQLLDNQYLSNGGPAKPITPTRETT
jgi:hypothetical protein